MTRLRIQTVLIAMVIAMTPALAISQEWKRPGSPFVVGEGYPEVPATCETAKYWIDHEPDIEGRISFAIKGDLVVSDFDGALAYLIMCEEKDVQVLCVSYSNDDRKVGDTVLFAGGYNRAGERRIMLDPCLAAK